MENLRGNDLGMVNGKRGKAWMPKPELFPCIYLCRTLANCPSLQADFGEKEISPGSRKFDTIKFIVTGIPRVNPATIS
jgi:hypothetical protein